ncbi:hypothetical protein O3P69_013959 [Scylla paramamosain]|uniref:Ionotropic glutamate receptor L-glutamate and glycine-binding domain-containing protein n=1 Tax=Scylla paramamosain TaxID=85552 RepID=A0AAW0SR77_SCYPA
MGRCLYNETDPQERLLFTWLWSGGVSFRSIAKQTRRSPTTVRKWVRRLLGEDLSGTVVVQGAGQVVENYLVQCHLVLASPGPSPVLADLIRVWSPALHRGLHSSGNAACRVFIVDHTDGNASAAVWLLQQGELWRRPETRVLVLGDTSNVDVLLQHSALRNTQHALYITPARTTTHALWATGELPDRFRLTGRTLRVVAKTYFPYFHYERVSDKPGTLVLPRDSLNARMIAAIATAYNFTYEVREPEDGEWGLPAGGGNWTGLIGTLQHEKADFSVDLTVTLQRAEVVDFSVIYIDEPVAIFSSKPKPLPEYLSLVRPLEETGAESYAWTAQCKLSPRPSSMAGVCCSRTTLTTLPPTSRARQDYNFVHFIHPYLVYLTDCLILISPLTRFTVVSFGRILVGFWLIVCFIVTTAYRSSLISHLVVQDLSDAIDNMNDLVERGNSEDWTWGVRRMTGSLKSYLSTSQDPAMLEVYQKMRTVGIKEGLEKVVRGGFSYIFNYYYIKPVIDTEYTDGRGYSPIYSSKTIPGAPFQDDLSKGIQNILEGGLVAFWMNDVIRGYVREEGKRAGKGGTGIQQLSFSTGEDEEAVLRLTHMQGTFYTLLLGHAAASLVHLAEHLLACRPL